MNKMMKVVSGVFAGAVLSAAALSSANAQIPIWALYSPMRSSAMRPF